MKFSRFFPGVLSSMAVLVAAGSSPGFALTFSDNPLSDSLGSSSMVMMTLGRDHTLAFEAYNDSQDIYNASYLSQLNGKQFSDLSPDEQTALISKPDGIVDNRYIPDVNFKYYGYFESDKCYSYTGSTAWNPTSYSTTDKLFSPVGSTSTKKCPGQWSGDFLNYLTMTRIDILRKALYGGWRDTDTATETILQRAYIPQDTHAFGKEYTSQAVDGYLISDYTPLSQPSNGTRHLFSSVTLALTATNTAPKPPSLQVLPNSAFRIWDWVSIERPIAGKKCLNGENGVDCEVTSSSAQGIPTVATQTDFELNWQKYALTLDSSLPTVMTSGGLNAPSNHGDGYFLEITGFLDLTTEVASGSMQLMLDGVDDSAELYLGSQSQPISRVYDGYNNAASPAGILNCGGGNGTSLVTRPNATASVNDGQAADDRCYADIKFNQTVESVTVLTDRISASFKSFANPARVPFKIRYLENTGGDGVKLMYKNGLTSKALLPQDRFYNAAGTQNQVDIKKYVNKPPLSSISSYVVRVKACTAANDAYGCGKYGANYKPEGLLQQYDKKDSLLFGLLTGSYTKNLQGGVLRKNIGRFNDEFDSVNGTFKAVDGVVKTLNAIRVSRFKLDTGKTPAFPLYEDCHNPGDGFIGSNPFDPAIPSGKCQDWGNPIAEMMYESLRYLQGDTSTIGGSAAPVNAFSRDFSNNPIGAELNNNLPAPPTWKNPFTTNNITDSSCVQPYQIVVSDINPSYDFDTLPGGTNSGSAGSLKGYQANGSAAPNLDVASLGKLLWDDEIGGTKNVFIGHSDSATFDPFVEGAPSAKTASSFADLHGPWREAFHQGSYHAGSVAYYGQANKVANFAAGSSKAQPVKTMAVVMSSPVPQIDIPLTTNDLTKTISLIPFARTVGGMTYGTFGVDVNKEPGNQVADFYYTEPLHNKDPNDPSKGMLGQFVVGYENLPQGADYDMDMRLTYNVETFPDANHSGGGTLRISLNSSPNSYTNSDGRILPAGAAYGSLVQHAGLVISGAADTVKGKDGNDYKVNGPWLFVRDCDTLLNMKNQGPDNCVSATDDYDRPNHSLYMSEQVGTPGSRPVFNGKTPQQPVTWTFTINYPAASNSANVFLKDPLWYAAKWGNFDDTNNNQKPDLVSEWDKVNNDTQKSGADGVPDGYFYAKNPGLLPNQLAKAFDSIKPPVGIDRSGGGVAVSNGLYDSSLLNLQFSSRYRNDKKAGWIGDLIAEKLVVVPATLSSPSLKSLQSVWSASDLLSSRTAARKIWTAKVDGSSWSAVDFDYAVLGANQKTSLDATAATATKLVDYLKGSGADEGTLFRERQESNGTRRILGDIIDSPVVYVGKPQQITVEPGYASFQSTYANRKPMVYVGANDGMLHGFDAETGEEKFAFVPSTIMHKLKELGSKTYDHKFFVNGQLVALDANFGTSASPSWKTVLIGGYGSGAKGIFALDVTDPTNSNFGKPLWEFTDAAVAYSVADGRSFGANLGHQFGQASVAKLANGEWGVLFGNGYNSTADTASLYVLKLSDGSLLKRLDTNTSITGNGLSAITAVDFGVKTAGVYNTLQDGQVDMVVGGDLKGNVWQFDLSDPSPANWTTVNFGATAALTPLFSAKSASTGNPAQPITGQILVSRLNGQQIQLTFGTGQYLETADKTTSNIQSLYSIRAWVNSGTYKAVQASKLFRVNSYYATHAVTGESFRLTQAAGSGVNTLNGGAMLWDDTSGYQGWTMDLVEDSKNLNSGWNSRNERVVTDPRLTNEAPMAQFTTLMPQGNSCSSSNASSVLRACLFDGTTACANGKPIMDTNKDGLYNADDFVNNQSPAGFDHGAGLSKDGTVLVAGSGSGDSDSALSTFKDESGQQLLVNWLTPLLGRQSWRSVQ